MAASGLIQAGSRITAALLASIAPLAVIKAADESLPSSTVLQNDNELLLPVVGPAKYLFECYLEYEGSAVGTGDLKWTWSITNGTLRYQPIYVDATGAIQAGATKTGSGTVTAGTSGAGTLRGITMTGTLVTSAADTLQLQWAQNTSNATPTIVHAQSYLALWRQA